MPGLDFAAVLKPPYLEWLAAGALTTFALFLLSLAAAFAVGLAIAFLRSLALAPLDWATSLYVDYHRNVPTLVQLFVWYFGVPQLLPTPLALWINDHNSEFIFAVIGLSLNAGAYISEDLRSGLRSVAPGQEEAARALGLSHIQAMRDVLVPQGLRKAFPSLVNQTLTLFKTTSLAMTVGVAEMTYSSRQIENETYRTFETFAIATAFYVLVSLLIMFAGQLYDSRLATARGVLR